MSSDKKTDKPQVLQETILAKTDIFQIMDVHLRFSNGEERHFERIKGRSPGSVMVVPMLDEHTILLVREYGAGIDDYVLHFPKGSREVDEELMVTAQRELMEEVGYGANKLIRFATYCLSPGYVSAMMDVVLAKDLYPKKLAGDEPEPLVVVSWRLDQVDKLLAHPEFHEARSVAALLLLEKRWKQHAS